MLKNLSRAMLAHTLAAAYPVVFVIGTFGVHLQASLQSAYGNTGSTINQQIWNLSRQNFRLFLSSVLIFLKINSVFI